MPQRLLEGLRVLVVDDHEDSVELFVVALTDFGAETKGARTFDGALEVVDGWSPHVVLADVLLPERDGYELIAAVRARCGDVPAIAVTGCAAEADRARALSRGFDEFVAKPATPGAIVAAIRRVTAPR